jgi:hypothetical protein
MLRTEEWREGDSSFTNELFHCVAFLLLSAAHYFFAHRAKERKRIFDEIQLLCTGFSFSLILRAIFFCAQRIREKENIIEDRSDLRCLSLLLLCSVRFSYCAQSKGEKEGKSNNK